MVQHAFSAAEIIKEPYNEYRVVSMMFRALEKKDALGFTNCNANGKKLSAMGSNTG